MLSLSYTDLSSHRVLPGQAYASMECTCITLTILKNKLQFSISKLPIIRGGASGPASKAMA